VRISGSQFGAILFLTIVTTAVLYIPNITAREAKQSAWLAPILSSGMGFLILWIFVKLGERFPGQNLVQFSTQLLGKFLGKALGLGYCLFFLVINFFTLRQFSEAMNLSLLQHTPVWFVSLWLALVGSYGAILGLEVITRSIQFVLPLFVISIILVILFTFPDLEYKQLFPLFEGGVWPIVKASYSPATWFGESIVLAFLFPFINKPQEVFKKSTWALLAAILVFSADILVTLLLLGPELASSYDLAFWKVIRYIEVGRTFLRLETIIIFLWISAVVAKFALVLYLGGLVLAEVWGRQSPGKIVVPMALLTALISTTFLNSSIDLQYALSAFWPKFALIFELFIPCFLLFVAWLRKKGSKAT